MTRVLDIHSHILFGVDDGAESIDKSVKMLDAAKHAGIRCIYATPHWKSKHGDRERIRRNFRALLPYAEQAGIALHLGYEYNLAALDILQFEAAKDFTLENTESLLLEFPFESWPAEWERILLRLQRIGLQIVIAHPERYLPVQRDLGVLKELLELGCLLQCNASSVLSHRPEKKRVMRYIRQLGRLDFLASDAHSASDYAVFEKAVAQVAGEIRYPSY